MREMPMEFIRKLPVPLELKRQFPITEEIARIKDERDDEIARIMANRKAKIRLWDWSRCRRR